MSDWRDSSFEQLYAIPSKNGITRPARSRGVGHKMINMGELFAHDRINDIPMERVHLSERELSSALVEPGDLLFARQSLVLSGAGKCSIVTDVSEPTTFESHIIRVRLDTAVADPRFYHYYFKSPGSGMRAIVTQGVQAGIRANDLKRLVVCVPPIDQQRKVVLRLASYDDLIENNSRRIRLLENAARLLYREWFVRLRFPGHEHARIVDGVPKGWQRKQLGDIATLQYGKALKAESRVPGPHPVYGSSGIVGTHDAALSLGPGIIIGRKGNVGSLYWSCGDFYAIDTVYFIGPAESDLFLYYALCNTPFISTDVAVPGLNRNYAYSRPMLIPGDTLRNAFLDIVQPMHRQIETLTNQNQKLAAARDLLLPRLMSGEITP